MKACSTNKIITLTILCCTGLLFSTVLHAKQLHFKKQVKAGHIEYYYTFTTASGSHHKIHFSLDREQSEISKSLFTKTKKHRLNQRAKQKAEELFNTLQVEYIEQARDEFDAYISEQASRLPAGIIIESQNKGKNIRAKSDGSMPKARAESIIDDFLASMKTKWQSLNQQYLDAFKVDVAKRTQDHYVDTYKREYYVASFASDDARSYNLRIDFGQIAELHARAMKPVSDAVAANTRGMSRREVMNYAAHFIQSIPYDTLNSRDANGEIGFVAPLTLFDINKGDCDTKSTALAAILHNLYPDLDIKMVLIPNHAFLAIGFEGEPDDTVILYYDDEYVVVEAAGPALTPIGESYEASLKHMQANPDKIGRIIPLLDNKPG